MVQNVRKISVKNWILGGTFTWAQAVNTNDPASGKFYIMQIQSDGSYKVVN